MNRILSRILPVGLAFFLPLAALAAETLAGSGKAVTEARNVSGFTAVAFALPGKLQVTQGDKESLALTADDNVMREIETVVEKGTLKIKFTRDNVNVRNAKIVAVLTVRNIESLAVAGSGDVATGPLKAQKFAVLIGGSGNVVIDTVNAFEVNVRIGGSGDLAVGGGRTEALTVAIGGSGELKAPKLESKRAKVSIGGSGGASLWARETLNVSVAGSGSVRYYGDPAVEKAIVGSGDIRRAGPSPS
jgi:Putative auto-transporter adhesin, head GIN domain